MKSVAILMPQRIGEFVLALSVASRIDSEGNEKITLIVPQHLIPLCTLLSTLPYFPYRRSNRGELLDSIAGVKRQNFDELCVLTNSLSTAWFALRTGIPERRGPGGGITNPFFTKTFEQKESVHLTEQYAQILGCDHVPPQLWPGISIDPAEPAEQSVVLCPGSSGGAAKQWSGYREIVKLLPSYRFTLLGDLGDVGAAKSITRHFPHRVRNLVGKTSIESAAAQLAGASVVIANHNGLMHLAGFLGTPVVGIFGSTSAQRHRPLGNGVRCADGASVCAPCNAKSCSRRDRACLLAITAQRVIELAGEIVRPDRCA